VLNRDAPKSWLHFKAAWCPAFSKLAASELEVLEIENNLKKRFLIFLNFKINFLLYF